MNILYLLFIKPIETVLSFLFSTYVRLTGSYGLSIILLSLSVTTIMFPLFYIAEVWKRKEQAVEKRMKHRLAYIKKYFTGQKRYCMIKATHRLEGYTAASSFRTSFGLLIQIPFFFAAYHLLSHYEPYRGVSWLFIKDFALPDGLLWGLNLLPIAMTVINIVSSSIYMKGSRPKDIVELYVMAGVFLLLLYASPSALVLYWTMNNIFSIGKSLIFLRLFPHEKYVPDPEDKSFADYVQGIREAIRPCINAGFCVFMAMAVLFALQCRVLILHKRYFVPFFCLTALVAFAFCIVFLIRWIADFRKKKASWTPLVRILCTGVVFLAVSAFGAIITLKGSDGIIRKKTVFIATVLADVLIFEAACWLWCGSRTGKAANSYKEKDFRTLYVWDVLFLAGLTVLVWPLLVYLSSPAETGITLWHLLGSTFPVFLIVLVLALGLYRIAGKPLKEKLVLVSLFLVLGVAVFRFIIPGDYGELDKTILSLEDKLTDRSIFLFVRDLVVLAVLALATQVLIRKYPAQCTSCVAIIFCCFIVFAGTKAVKFLASPESHGVQKTEVAELPANNGIINGYSKEGKNVVLFVSDMFSGGYMERILEECPEYRDKLKGFIWYRNCLAPSLKTAYSMASIFAGDEYLPLAMNNMPGTGRDKMEKAAQSMFSQFESQGFDISMVNADDSYLTSKIKDKYNSADPDPYGKIWEQKYWKVSGKEKGFNQGHLFIMLSLFQSAPYFLKPVIYNNSQWLVFSLASLFWSVKEHVVPHYGFVSLMPTVSNIDAPGNTFKYFHSSLSHSPFGLDKDGNLVEPGVFPDPEENNYTLGDSAYYSAKEFIHLFIGWCDWLKEKGIYDNTYIILLSDHGNDYTDNNPLVEGKLQNRLNALLMVKGYDEKADLQIDNRFMMANDAHCFYDNSLGNPLVLPDRNVGESVKPSKGDKTSVFINTDARIDYDIYRVTDSIFDPKNWQVIK